MEREIGLERCKVNEEVGVSKESEESEKGIAYKVLLVTGGGLYTQRSCGLKLESV